MKLFRRATIASLLIGVSLFLWFTTAQVPREYEANFGIQENWNAILDDFIKLEAAKQIGWDPDLAIFSRLASNFWRVFPQLPQEGEFKIVYEQCQQLANSTRSSYTYDAFVWFMERCFSPLNNIIKQVNSKYTIKPSANANPSSWPASLTVTFDARNSTDPSNDTIPTDNFFWYFKDTEWRDTIIGRGAVVNYTFEKEGNYIVHLTARSANNSTEWILDGETTIGVNVSPEAANLVVYANGQQLSEETPIKIGTQEAARGVNFDWSATSAKGGRKILSHTREIAWPWFTYQTESKLNAPKSENVILPNNGEYLVTLRTEDNESNVMIKTFLLIVSDPIATIEQSPAQGDTTTNFTFDASSSYSIQSRLRLYTREVFDEDGESIYTVQSQDFTRSFDEPGNYVVKLTVEDELDQENIETVNVYVESSSPIPQFSVEPVAERKYPSQFILDASLTLDEDVIKGNDELSYERRFSHPATATIDQSINDDEKVVVSFDDPGTYQVTLIVTDDYGKLAEITKDIEVLSSLRPVIFASPRATVRWKKITFAVKSNKNLINYQRDFGDNTTRIIQSNVIQHTYEAAGVYDVTLTAVGRKGEENSITTKVFIGEQNSPVAAYEILDDNNTIIKQDGMCIDEDGVEQAAYILERYNTFTIDINDSVNIKGQNQWLQWYFQPQDDEIFRSNRFNYRFADLGCRYIYVTVEDTDIGKNNRLKIWFQVENALPKIDNITLFFPQFGNELGVGFQENRVQDIFSSEIDPLIIKVIAANAVDPDGIISFFTRYYYHREDPSRILETRITPSNIPYAFFTLPKIPGEYMFGVKMMDNDGGEITSEEIIGNGPIVFFPPDTRNVDIPIVTLRVDKVNVSAWDEVTFDVIAKTVSQRDDFNAKRTIRYDFDGDTVRDLTTKDDSVTHIYTEPSETGWYRPRVEVSYRWFKGTAFGEPISVKNGLKPRILYTLYDKTLLARDISIGQIAEKQFCFDRRQCRADNNYIVTQGETFVFEYPDYGQYVTEFSVTDVFGNSAIERQVINIEEPDVLPDIEIVSLPETRTVDGEPVVSVGKNLDNSVLINLKYFGIGQCFVDSDISRDSNNDGAADQDRDFQCNQAVLIPFEPEFERITARVFYETPVEWSLKLTSRDFTIEFLDFQPPLSEEQRKLYIQLSSLIKDIDQTEDINKELVNLLIDMRNNLYTDQDIATSVVSIRDYMDTQELLLSESQQADLDALLTSLSDGAIVAALWGTPYEQAKQDILFSLPQNLKPDAESIFLQIEQVDARPDNKGRIKELLQQLISTLQPYIVPVSDEPTDTQISQDIFDLFIIGAVCDILNIYEIESDVCPNVEDLTEEEWEEDITIGWTGRSIMRTILIVVGILFLLFIGLIGAFAVRARLQQKQEQEWEEESQ